MGRPRSAERTQDWARADFRTDSVGNDRQQTGLDYYCSQPCGFHFDSCFELRQKLADWHSCAAFGLGLESLGGSNHPSRLDCKGAVGAGCSAGLGRDTPCSEGGKYSDEWDLDCLGIQIAADLGTRSPSSSPCRQELKSRHPLRLQVGQDFLHFVAYFQEGRCWRPRFVAVVGNQQGC